MVGRSAVTRTLFELEALLAEHKNNVTAAARAADVDRIHFYRLLWKHGLREHTPEKPTESSGE
jgi:transcriptional regulator of acetoin/glycerol metabolism